MLIIRSSDSYEGYEVKIKWSYNSLFLFQVLCIFKKYKWDYIHIYGFIIPFHLVLCGKR